MVSYVNFILQKQKVLQDSSFHCYKNEAEISRTRHLVLVSCRESQKQKHLNISVLFFILAHVLCPNT